MYLLDALALTTLTHICTTLCELRAWLVDTDNASNSHWDFQLFVDPQACSPGSSELWCDQELVATRNRGYLEYQALRRFLRQCDEIDGSDLEELFQRELCDLEARHELPVSNRLNDHNFSRNPVLLWR